ncbi:hypothetical protein GOP47_0017069 [Adiantum capillus-veneris]|uniref:Uncharacterized protein n=1 Tax=Adiantum capillus-veneris TaxID=13818 RepID=A0A9D4ZB98_ADICA|nr:hypothetical protein GOP47_0016454 [Adiantum capillus-veneris]KAI5068724.1 hypothetical protein GOP47_0017069 [Adiantum capillus-veneris]
MAAWERAVGLRDRPFLGLEVLAALPSRSRRFLASPLFLAAGEDALPAPLGCESRPGICLFSGMDGALWQGLSDMVALEFRLCGVGSPSARSPGVSSSRVVLVHAMVQGSPQQPGASRHLVFSLLCGLWWHPGGGLSQPVGVGSGSRLPLGTLKGGC